MHNRNNGQRHKAPGRPSNRGAFKRAKDGLEAQGEKVVRLTEKGRNVMHVTAS